MTKASDSPTKMTAREHAAMNLKVPASGTEWLDDMINAARDLDAEQFEAKLKEPTPLESLKTKAFENPEVEAEYDRIVDSEKEEVPQGPKNPPKGGRDKKIA